MTAAEAVPPGFEPLFRTSPFRESSADIQRIGGRLAFVNVYLAVGSNRIVRASGVYVRGDGGARGGLAT